MEAAEGKRKKGRGRGVLRGGGGTGRAPHLSVAAAGGSGGGTAPYPRTPERNRPPTRRPRAAAEATGRERWAGAAAEATAMAFLKLRDQVGEGRRGGIAPTGWKEGGTGGPASQRCGPPGRPLGAMAAREAVCRPGDARGAVRPGTRATFLSAKPGLGLAHVPLGGSQPPPDAAARGAGPALPAWASAAGEPPGLRLRSLLPGEARA